MLHRHLLSLSIACACALAGAGPLQAADLLSAEAVLARSARPTAATAADLSPAAKLLGEIRAYRQRSTSLAPAAAAKQWLGLWQQGTALAALPPAADYSGYDSGIGAPAGLRSVLSALPPPAAWDELRKQIDIAVGKRSGQREALALRMLGEALSQDRRSLATSIESMRALVKDADEGERDSADASIDQLQATLTTLYGDPEAIAAQFLSDAAKAAKRAYDPSVATPDLVGLVGEEKARELLLSALRLPVLLSIESGDATRSLARTLALSHLGELKRAQWNLVDGADPIGFYEAMQARFVAPANSDGSDEASAFDFLRRGADTHYLVALISAGRHQDAARLLPRLSGEMELYLSKDVLQRLQVQGQAAELARFLAASLRRQPELEVWTLYLQQAAAAGLHAEAIELLDDIGARAELPLALRKKLELSRIEALLAADRLDDAIALLSARVLKHSPDSDEEHLLRLQWSVRLASLGRVLQRPEVVEPAFAAARQSALQLIPRADQHYEFGERLQALYAELRRQDQAPQAQQLALAVLEQAASRSGNEFAFFNPNALQRAALVELSGLFHGAGRSGDVLQLVDASPAWDVRDVANLVAEKDSLGVPLGVMVARALQAAEQTSAARQTVDALLQRLPGHDAGYALLLELLGEQAPAELDRRYGLDPFEERPLIWKAIALQQSGQHEASEQSIRAAIAVDPSDGEQGRGDRMRAYAVLAELLDARGDGAAAGVYRGAVAAIRLSEQADELHALGLYRRAFDTYREALEHFADAYCIQSRLAVQLSKQGLQEQALVHYRRAYELMPDSFGRVESHCFGCESVFQNPQAQGIADEVFQSIIRSQPERPQAHYMLAYLRIEQGRPQQALEHLRRAVGLDGDYLNAWKKLHELGAQTYIPAAERDIARLKLAELDPAQRHVDYDLNQVGDLRALWNTVELAQTRLRQASPSKPVYPFAASTLSIEQAIAGMPESMRQQSEQYFRLADEAANPDPSTLTPARVLATHALLQPILALAGEPDRDGGHFE